MERRFRNNIIITPIMSTFYFIAREDYLRFQTFPFSYTDNPTSLNH